MEEPDTRTEARGFHPIDATRASHEVVDQLADAILEGRYKIGDRLPRVADLATIMDVSRSTVGEAVRIMADAGVLSIKRGAGGGITVRSDILPPSIVRIASARLARDVTELAEARRPVEMQLARLAVARAREEDLEEMRAALVAMEEASTPAEWGFANIKFHLALGRAAQSPLLAHLQREVFQEMAVLIDAQSSRDTIDHRPTLAEHREILAALEARDRDRVVRAVDVHLRELESSTGGQEA